jgi:hypothetical protein
MEGVAYKKTLHLSDDAKKAVGSVPGEGTELTVHRFLSGQLTGKATWSMWDNLAVNVEGGQATQSIGPNGSPRFRVRTHWYWDQWGPNSNSWMENQIDLDDTGKPTITADYDKGDM